MSRSNVPSDPEDFDEEEEQGLEEFYKTRGRRTRDEQRAELQKQRQMQVLGYVFIGALGLGLFLYLLSIGLYFWAIGALFVLFVALVIIKEVLRGKRA